MMLLLCVQDECTLSCDQCCCEVPVMDSDDKSPQSVFSLRDKCWLCQLARRDDDQTDADDGTVYVNFC